MTIAVLDLHSLAETRVTKSVGVQVGWGGDSVRVGVGDSVLHVMRVAVITPGCRREEYSCWSGW
jgi:hypothetical protein